MSEKPKLAAIEPIIHSHLAAIADLFVDGCKLTLVMRNPAFPESGGFVMTDEDDREEPINEIRRRLPA